ncbi:Pentatricopeptide repeat-containing protein [Acorus gramineus]|uniref:Pentatricopeptide repeat-containing protein n=1 Tax=Acorus gramineus TaxID=55184 RepID=A0AAV9AJW1_ACOGR|nr:Pentatricopeptide repeat-containing protein [Acorus gramineus]
MRAKTGVVLRRCVGLLRPYHHIENYGPLNWTSSTEVGVSARFLSKYTGGTVEGHWYSDHGSTLRRQDQHAVQSTTPSEVTQDKYGTDPFSMSNDVTQQKRNGRNISTTEKTKYLLKILFELRESKEAVYGALDAWVAWEQNFPLVALKRALTTLEKEQQWHKIVQVIKWMLSKGQGTTMGTYGQLILALEKDHRAEEAHKIWVQKIGLDLHSVPWQLCNLMISIYYRNNMLQRLVKLFRDIESYDRKPTDKLIVQKVADAYELLGLPEDKKRILEKYDYLFNESSRLHFKKSKKKFGKKSANASQIIGGDSEALVDGFKERGLRADGEVDTDDTSNHEGHLVTMDNHHSACIPRHNDAAFSSALV